MRRQNTERGRRDDVAYLIGLGSALAFVALLGPLQRRIEMLGADDFSRIWAGPRALLVGANPYDPASWAATAVALGTQVPDTGVFIYPPWVTLALLPFALLPLPLASLVWLLASVAAATYAMRALLQAFLPGRAPAHALTALTLLLSAPAILSLVIGQWSFLLVAALSATVLLLRAGRPVAAGLSALAMLAKPQLFVFAAPALAVRALWPVPPGRAVGDGRRFVLIAAGAGLAAVALSWLLVPQWWPSWPQHVGGNQLKPDSDTIPALLFTLFGPAGLWLGPLILLAAVVVALQFHPRGEAWLPVWFALSSAGTPYSNSYDQLLLIVPVVIASGVLARRSAVRATAVLVTGAAILLILTPLMYALAVLRHSETFGVLVPAAVFVLVVASLWPQRRVLDSPPPY